MCGGRPGSSACRARRSGRCWRSRCRRAISGRSRCARPKLGPWLGVIDQILENDESQPKKQRHTARRIYDRLKEEHAFTGGYTIVKDYVRDARLRHKEVFVPLAHPPGDAQADFGEALVVIGGVEQKAHFLCVDLPHSDDSFVVAFPAENTEAFCEGHNQAFAYLGGVPRTMLYDNTKIAVKEITGDGERKPTEEFSRLQSHYLFEVKFGRPGKGNDKGNVEGLVGYARRNFMVPVPRAASWEELNAQLTGAMPQDGGSASCGGTARPSPSGSSGTRRSCCRCRRRRTKRARNAPTRASSQALVRYETNDYSVPVAYGHQRVLVKAFVWEVVIACGSEVIARHRRSYGREEMIFDPLHYLALLEQKTECAGPGGAARGLGVAGGVRGTAAADGGAAGQARAARVRAGAAVAGDVHDGRSERGHPASAVAASDLLRCGQAPAAVRHRAAAAEAGPGELSAPAAGASGADAGGRLSGAVAGGRSVMDTPQVLLEHYLKQLKLPTMLREYAKLAEQCAKEGVDFQRFLLRLVEAEMLDRERRATERRIKAAKFPVVIHPAAVRRCPASRRRSEK